MLRKQIEMTNRTNGARFVFEIGQLHTHTHSFKHAPVGFAIANAHTTNARIGQSGPVTCVDYANRSERFRESECSDSFG